MTYLCFQFQKTRANTENNRTNSYGESLVSSSQTTMHLMDVSDTSDNEGDTSENSDGLSIFMKLQAEIQRQRKQTLQAACRKYKPPKSNGKYSVESPKRFIIDLPHKLVYCSVAKVASTNWRWVFEQLSGAISPGQSVEQRQINKQLKKELTFMTSLQPMTVQQIWEKSLTFMFARHPFSRVLSAYRNKLDPNTTFERARYWQHSLGVPIIKKYRKKSLKNKFSFLSSSYDLKFSEFVHFLGDKTNKGNNFYSNIHWADLNKQCSPCDVDYDVIGKLETLDDDVKYILTLANLQDQVQFAEPASSSPTYSYKSNTLENYLESVPAPLIRNLYERYELDFKLFGYELPDVAKRKLGNAKLRYK